ncbi:MAG: hypothetical protein PVF58_14355 [Candidatus Methanofastidiosia archaeon]|jgi:hypothetical protein
MNTLIGYDPTMDLIFLLLIIFLTFLVTPTVITLLFMVVLKITIYAGFLESISTWLWLVYSLLVYLVVFIVSLLTGWRIYDFVVA